MEETIMGTFDNVKFIQGVTKMNQPNWQEYFGGALPNGVYEGFLADERYIYDGTVFVNGIFAKVETGEGKTDLGLIGATDPSTGDEIPPYDRFICLRVWFAEEKVEIVQKTGFAEWFGMSNISQYEDSLVEQIVQFIRDESYGCTRNEFYYDVPIYYQGVNNVETILQYGINLRRLVNLNRKREVNLYLDSTPKPELSNFNRQISGSNSYTDGHVRNIFLDPINHPDGALICTQYGATINLETFPFVNHISHGDTSRLSGVKKLYTEFQFAQPELWTRSSDGDYYTMSVTEDNTMIRITLISDDHYGSSYTNLWLYYFVEVFS